MISIVLIAPIIFCLILLFAKNNKLNNFFMVLYSIIHATLGLSYFIQPDLIQNNQYAIETHFGVAYPGPHNQEPLQGSLRLKLVASVRAYQKYFLTVCLHPSVVGLATWSFCPQS